MRSCPKCGNKKTGWKPESLEEAVYGLWTCDSCGLQLNHRNNPISDEDANNQRRCVMGDICGLVLAGVIIALGLVFLGTAGEMTVLLVTTVSVIIFLMARSMVRH
jgi:hypothetical protein